MTAVLSLVPKSPRRKQPLLVSACAFGTSLILGPAAVALATMPHGPYSAMTITVGITLGTGAAFALLASLFVLADAWLNDKRLY